MDSAEIGSFIRREHKKQRLTLEQLAALAGVGVRFVREVEHGKPSCQLALVLKVMRILGLSIKVHARGE